MGAPVGVGMKDKLVAALLAFFLGSFGIHKFYLAQNGWGVAYLLFCWTGVPALAGFVECFLLLFSSESQFNQRFNNGLALSSLNNPLQQAQGIEKLAELHQKGLITDDEFETKRRKFLERM